MQNGRVLLVEDEPALSRLLATYLARAGFEVTACLSGLEALAAMEAESDPWRCGVFDLTLTDIAGEGVASAFRERFPDAAIILMSGLPSSTTESIPGSIFLQKPFFGVELVRLIQEGESRAAGL